MKIKALPSKSYLNSIFRYEDGKLYWTVDRHPAIAAGRLAGKKTNIGYRKIMVDGVFYSEHRIIYKMMNDSFDESKFIDHIDCDKTNNRIENLRLADKYQNMHNQAWPKRNECTKSKGIDVIKNGVFRARVQHIGKRIVKHFSSFELAESWLISTRSKLHAEFSNNG